MSDEEFGTQHAVWDPEARGGAGGWVMRPVAGQQPPAGGSNPAATSVDRPDASGGGAGGGTAGGTSGGTGGSGDTGPAPTRQQMWTPASAPWEATSVEQQQPVPPQTSTDGSLAAGTRTMSGVPGQPAGQAAGSNSFTGGPQSGAQSGAQPTAQTAQQHYSQGGPPGPPEAAVPPPGGRPPRRGGFPKWLLMVLVVLVSGGVGVGLVLVLNPNKDDKGGEGGKQPGKSASGSKKPGSKGSSKKSSSSRSSKSSSRSPSAADTAGKQAAAVDKLLDRSKTSRDMVVSAVNRVSACASQSNVSGAKKDLNSEAANRDQLVSELDKLKVDKISGGASAMADLRSAWQSSAKADRSYAAWAGEVESSCTPNNVERTGSYSTANGYSGDASKAKKSFTDKWTPIASEHGLQSRGKDEL